MKEQFFEVMWWTGAWGGGYHIEKEHMRSDVMPTAAPVASMNCYVSPIHEAPVRSRARLSGNDKWVGKRWKD